MIVTRTVDYDALDPRNAKTYSVTRQTWREWFSFMVSWDVDILFAEKRPLGWQQSLYRRILNKDYARAIVWYQIVPLCFVSDAIWLLDKHVWHALGFRLYKLGYLHLPPEGEQISRFWLRYITFRKCEQKDL
jgi:hypothetical protein